MDRRERHKETIRQTFLQAAMQLILEKGYDNVTVAEIARRADYGRSTFYVYFNDKEDLVWAILEHYMVILDEQIQDAVGRLESPLREWRAWRILFADIAQQSMAFRQMDGELSRRLRQMQKDYVVQRFEQQLRDGEFSLMTDVAPEIAARFVVGAQLEILDYWLQHPEQGTAEQMADDFFRLVFRDNPPSED